VSRRLLTAPHRLLAPVFFHFDFCGKPLPIDSLEDRRNELALWLTSRENSYFSRSIVNRVWANFCGVGLVEKVDDMRVTNPASNEKLLAATARHLADQKYDLKALMRSILQSETYQRSSVARAGNSADNRFYSRYFPRRMMAEVLLDAMSQVTGAPTRFISHSFSWVMGVLGGDVGLVVGAARTSDANGAIRQAARTAARCSSNILKGPSGKERRIANSHPQHPFGRQDGAGTMFRSFSD